MKRRGKEILTLPSKRKSPRLEIDASHTKRLSIRAIEDQSPVAAAASTVLYSLQYGDGGGDGDDLADDSIESPSGKADQVPKQMIRYTMFLHCWLQRRRDDPRRMSAKRV